MKLSILIPTYNNVCTELVAALSRQLPADAELIVGDDGSTKEEVKAKNRLINNLRNCRVWEAERNMGRAAIRNRLTELACGDYLLFIDSDARVVSNYFIRNYMAETQANTVVCGGIIHPETLPNERVSLRWKYEKTCEPKFTAEERNRNPYGHLRTFNFMMPRPVALANPFDESITLYGYEDTLLGKTLKVKGVDIKHIDNTLENIDIEENEVFLKKTEESMLNLKLLHNEMRGYSTLLDLYDKLGRWHLLPLLKVMFKMTRRTMRKHLVGRNPSVRLLQAYKLGYFATLQ